MLKSPSLDPDGCRLWEELSTEFDARVTDRAATELILEAIRELLIGNTENTVTVYIP